MQEEHVFLQVYSPSIYLMPRETKICLEDPWARTNNRDLLLSIETKIFQRITTESNITYEGHLSDLLSTIFK